MKNKYQRLSKEDKIECKAMYYRTNKGKEMRLRLLRLNIIGILGILFGIYLISHGLITKQIQWYDYGIAITLFLFSCLFLIGALLVRQKVLNQFALKIPRFKNK